MLQVPSGRWSQVLPANEIAGETRLRHHGQILARVDITWMHSGHSRSKLFIGGPSPGCIEAHGSSRTAAFLIARTFAVMTSTAKSAATKRMNVATPNAPAIWIVMGCLSV